MRVGVKVQKLSRSNFPFNNQLSDSSANGQNRAKARQIGQLAAFWTIRWCVGLPAQPAAQSDNQRQATKSRLAAICS